MSTAAGGADGGRHLGPRRLEPVVPPVGEPPEDIGTGHPMRAVTERIVADPSWWGPDAAAEVAAGFDELAPTWDTRSSAAVASVGLLDALDRGGSMPAPVVELGAGTGSGTEVLAERFTHVVALDLSAEMLARLRVDGASPVRGDASALPLRTASVGTLVCVNVFLFAAEVVRVLRPDGALVWVNTMGERTPIHLPDDVVAAALGPGFEVVSSRAGWSTWAVARRV